MKSYGVTIQMKATEQYSHMVLFIYYVVTFESVVQGPIFLVCSSNFWASEQNSMVLSFKWNLFTRTFS